MPTFDGIYKHTNGLRKKAFFYLSPPVIFYLPFQGGASFVDHFCYLCFMFVFIILSCLLLADLRSPAGKGLTSWFYVCDVSLCCVTFPYGVSGKVWYLMVSIPDLCLLPYF